MGKRMWSSLLIMVLGTLALGGITGAAPKQQPIPTPSQAIVEAMPFFGDGFLSQGLGHDPIYVEGMAKASGLSVLEVNRLLRNGKSFADIAKDKGVTKDKLTDGLVSAYQKMLDSKTTDGYLTKDEADSALDSFKDQARMMAAMLLATVNSKDAPQIFRFRSQPTPNTPNSAQSTSITFKDSTIQRALADATGLKAADVAKELTTRSVADFAKNHKLTSAKLIDSLVKVGAARLKEMVSAKEATQAQADEWQKQLRTVATQTITELLKSGRHLIQEDLF